MASVSQSSWLERVLFGVFAFLLVWAPLPLASNRSWALGLLASGLWLLLGVTILCLIWRGESVLARLAPGRWPLLLLSLFAVLVFGQSLVLPLGVRALFVPGADTPGPVSVDAFNTQQYLLATLVHLAGFALTLLLARGERGVQVLAGVFVASGVLQALIAILLYASQAEYTFLFMHFEQGARASGTFANWDHLAGYMEMCLSIGIGLMLARMSSGSEREVTRRQKLVALLHFMMSRKMLLRLMLVIMVIALVLTHSRMGNAAFFISLLLVSCIGMARNKRLRKSAFWLVLSLVVVDVVVVGQWIGLDRVMQRLQGTELTQTQVVQLVPGAPREETLEERIRPARQSLAMVAERPWLGFGGASFYTAFPRFKSLELPWYYDHTHNDYVELAADTGLLGLGLLAGVVLLTIRRVVRLWGEQQSRVNRGIAFGGAMAICCLLLHSAVDFNLQMPANGLTFVVMLGLIWVLVPRSTAKNRRASA
ncbi:MAG: O-antigen ligase protein [Proteobacteria bacterium]|nr:O-antigen ligase protein [Pseudomonadota bacterium]